jgi:hypothetical protein
VPFYYNGSYWAWEPVLPDERGLYRPPPFRLFVVPDLFLLDGTIVHGLKAQRGNRNMIG